MNFDAEISADGETLYSVDSQFRNGRPTSSSFFIAHKHGSGFERAAGDEVFKHINGNELQYAASISADGLELFFTRIHKIEPNAEPRIWRAVRKSTRDPFEPPELISAIQGFAEGPTLSPDGLSLYYHFKAQGQFVIYRVTRPKAGTDSIAKSGCPAN